MPAGLRGARPGQRGCVSAPAASSALSLAGYGARNPGQRTRVARQGWLLRSVRAMLGRAESTTVRTNPSKWGALVPERRPPESAGSERHTASGSPKPYVLASSRSPPDGRPSPGRSGTTRVSNSHDSGPDAGRAAESELETSTKHQHGTVRGAETRLRRPREAARGRSSPPQALSDPPSAEATPQKPVSLQIRVHA